MKQSSRQGGTLAAMLLAASLTACSSGAGIHNP